MLAFSNHLDVSAFDARLRDAPEATAGLLSQIVADSRRSPSSAARSGKAARIERLIQSEAWTDAALALIDLQLPQWQVRRIAYDEGEWHCSLSRQRELPEWLDQSIEVHHADLPLAILAAFAEAQAATASAPQSSVPTVPRTAGGLFEAVCCDDFS